MRVVKRWAGSANVGNSNNSRMVSATGTNNNNNANNGNRFASDCIAIRCNTTINKSNLYTKGEIMQVIANVRNSHPVYGQNNKATVFNAVCTLQRLMEAENRCHRGVGYKNSVARYHMLAASKNYATLIELQNGTYQTQKGDNFEIYEPKHRIVTSTKYKDRIPQTSFILNYFYPVVVPNLINDNYTCLKGKGVDKARNKLKEMLRNAKPDDYVLKADIKDYFCSINHGIIAKELSNYIKDSWALDFFANVISANRQDVGITLGSEINQLSAVTFLNTLDHMLEGQYVRYMDDIVFIGSREAVTNAYKVIQGETARLGLSISKKKTYYQPVSRPIKFLGFTFLKHATGRITLKRIRSKYKAEKRRLKRMKNKGVSKDRIAEHYRCVRANMMKASRADIHELDIYYKEIMK